MKTRKVLEIPDVKNTTLLSKFTRIVLESASGMDIGGIVRFSPDTNLEEANLRQGTRAIKDVVNFNLAPMKFKWFIRQREGFLQRLE